jgi:phosphatidylglycerophosphate synthase
MNDRLSRLWATKTRDDEWWSSFVTAPLAVLVNYFVVDTTWLTPNRITLASFVVALVATALIVVGDTANFIVAALLIQLSHILDCMDGQMARYRNSSSASGSYFDRATDQIQVSLWFGAIAYAAYQQSLDVLPAFLAFVGVAGYSLRGYTKYVAIHTEMYRDANYLVRVAEDISAHDHDQQARASVRLWEELAWFITEQRKFFHFNEGVFVFMLSLALLLNELEALLWVFAASQLYYGLLRTWQHGRNVHLMRLDQVRK